MTAQFTVAGKKACKDPSVCLSFEGMTVTAASSLWQASYTVGDECFAGVLRSDEGVYHLPIVCGDQKVTLLDGGCTLRFEKGLVLRSTVPTDVDVGKRVFHQVGGFVYLPVKIPVKGEARFTLSVEG